MYQVSGPKGSTHRESDERSRHSTVASSFYLNYNIVMLACHFEAVRVLCFLYDEVILRQPKPTEFKNRLLHSRERAIHVPHLVAMLGNLDVLRCIAFTYGADFNARAAESGLTPLHCAAQVPSGLVSIYFLEHTARGFQVDSLDNFGASPLHYAIMNIEESNIQALLSMGADINLQDQRGDSMLHVAVARFVNDQDNYGVYKEVIK